MLLNYILKIIAKRKFYGTIVYLYTIAKFFTTTIYVLTSSIDNLNIIPKICKVCILYIIYLKCFI